MSTDTSNEMLEELRAIKNLLILQILASGLPQKHVATALNVSDATLSRMFPKGFARSVSAHSDRVDGGEPK